MNLGAYDRVVISVIRPSGYPHMAAFDEMLVALCSGFAALGLSVQTLDNFVPTGRNILKIVLGGHLLPLNPGLPPDAIILNAEQIPPVFDNCPAYRSLLQQHIVLDYSASNIAQLNAMPHRRAYFLRLGYAPELTRIGTAESQDVDVLFYGSINERRRKILLALMAAGLKIQTLFGAYGAERDAWIARSKLVINIHSYDVKVLEIVRCSYLLANRKAVVTEWDSETDVDPAFRGTMATAPYDELVDTCIGLIRNDAARHALEQRGFEIFSRHHQAQFLGPLLPDLAASAAAAQAP